MRRIDVLMEAGAMTHTAIVDTHLELVGDALVTCESRDLLAESARLARIEIPAIAEQATQLCRRCREGLCAPAVAASTAWELFCEVDRVEPKLRRMLGRQREIAVRLGEILAGSGLE